MTIKAEFEALKTLNQELSHKHDKHVKELKLDLRIAKRDAEKWQDTNRFLRDEKKELANQLSALQTTTEQMKDQMKSKDEQIQQLMRQIESLNKDLDSKSTDQKAIQDSFKDQIRCLNNETKALKDKLKSELSWKEKFEESDKKSNKLSKEVEELRKQMLNIRKELSASNEKVLQKEKELDKMKASYKILKDQCVEMDKQAEQFKNKYQGLGAIKQKLTLEKDSTLTEVQKLNNELYHLREQLKAAIAEKDEALKRLESREAQFKEFARAEKERTKNLEETLDEQYRKNQELKERIAEQEERLYGNEETIAHLDEKVSNLEEELYAIKEEAAKHITTIGELKEQSQKMTFAFEDLLEKQEEYQTKIDSLHNELDVKEEEMNRERIASHETLAQHLKLIDFLQSKVAGLEKQKKPLFSLTPTKAKYVNHNTHPVPLEVKDLDKLLAEEKTKNRRLIDELNRLKREVKSSIKSELCKSNDSTESESRSETFRKPLFTDNNRKYEDKRIDNELQWSTPPSYSATRMHHNIPHRFVEITNKIPNNKCVSCADVIHFGKKSKKCGECGATIHPKCAHRLPNNCGLPVQLMQQIFNSSGDVKPKNYYQSPPIDDIIEVHPEPSAPHESFVRYHSDSSATTDNNDDEHSDTGAVISRDTVDSPVNLKEIEDICNNKENDNFSFSDSLLDILEKADH